MINFSDYSTEDVDILPRSKALIYSLDNPREITDERLSTNGTYTESYYTNNFFQIGDYKIEPNGIDNNFPANYKALLDNVYLAHGVKRTLINLLLSGGFGLYREIVEEKKVVKDWTLDNQISDWLESFDFEKDYIVELATDMIYVENCYTIFQRNRGARFGDKPFIAGLKYLPVEKARLEYPDKNGIRKNIYHAEWFYNNLYPNDIQTIPIFDKSEPFKYPNSATFIKMPTFGSTSYGRPPDIGAAQLLKVLSLLPNYHRTNLTERGFKWIVSISKDYYKQICTDNRWDLNSEEFKEWKKLFIGKIDEFLSAPEGDKVQTRFLTEFGYDPFNHTTVDNIKITKLEDDTKELSEVGMSLWDTYSVGYVSSLGVHPQLGNVSLKNHALSGSELREAYEMHIKTATPTMRNLLLWAVNTAIKINFPDKNLKVGFMDVAFEEYNPVKNNKPVNN